MKVAVLPFNTGEGIKPALGRQFSAFAADQVRIHGDESTINPVAFLTQIQDDQGVTRVAHVNIQDELLPYEQLSDLFKQAEVELAMDGLLTGNSERFSLTVRFHGKETEEPVFSETWDFARSEVFATLRKLADVLARHVGATIPADANMFGTESAEAFLGFLEGHDALAYIQQANGAVATEFSPQISIDALVGAVELDPAWDGPMQVLVQLCRACAFYQIGTFPQVESALTRLITLRPEAFPPYFALGEIVSQIGDHSRAADLYEKAIQRQPDDPSLHSRLGMEQLQVGMPVNAERNFRKAIEIGGDDRSAYDYLAMVLTQTGRAHEVPAIWKPLIDANPQDGEAIAKYAYAQLQAGKEAEALKTFEDALESLEDNTIVKRFYAPILAQKDDDDRAMDFYEDCIDVAPNDIQLLTEYSQVLEKAGREVDLEEALKQILGSNPDPNTRAVTQARLIEIEQPKRIENVENARKKMESGDFEGAVRELKPLRNWLADYWKLWAMLAAAHNRLEQWPEAEEAANRLVGLYPACEPAYAELATAMNGQNRHDEAYNVMRFAAQNLPNSLPIHVNLALAAKRAGHSEEARALARQIREAIGPNEELEPVLTEIEA